MFLANRLRAAIYLVIPCAVGPFQASIAQQLSDRDVPALVQASRDNEIRFIRDYRGKTLVARGTFVRAPSGSLFGNDIRIEVRTSGGQINCNTGEASTLQKVADWDKGQPVVISGTVSTTVFGDVQLAGGCTVVAQ